MDYRYVTYTKKGEIAQVEFNRPEILNAMTWIGGGEDAAEFWSALDEAANDDDVKVVVLSGKGRAFTVGHDMNRVGFVYGFGEGQDSNDKRPGQQVRLKMDRDLYMDGYLKLFYHPKLTVASVKGYALAGGFILLSLCDFSVVAEDAAIGDVGMRYGFAGGGIPHFAMLVARVGLTRAVDLEVTGRWISGRRAEQIGLVTMAVPPERVDSETDRLAQGLSLYPRDGIAIGKATRHALYEAMGFSQSAAIGYISHTLFTNLKYEPGEWNFFRERRERGAKAAFHEKDLMWARYIDDYHPPEEE